MGLDGVELVMAFEEEFGIEITEAAAEKMRTPRDVVDYIAQFCTGQQRCTSRSGFYRFRRHCIHQHSVIRSTVRPETPLSCLLPAKQIRKAWTQLESELSVLGRSWPELDYPAPLRSGLFVIFLSLLVGLPLSIALATSLAVFPYALLVSGLLTFGLWKMFDNLMTHRRTVIPDSVATVGLLIQAVTPSEWTKASTTITAWGRERIAQRVKRLVIHHLGISESDYHEDARFIEDFGAD